jgi:integrase
MPVPPRTPTYSLTLRDGRYYVQWWADGRAKRVSCRTADLGEAKIFRASLIAGLGTPSPPKSPTIGAILVGYEADRNPTAALRAETYAVRALQRHLGDLAADMLTRERVRAYQAARLKEGPKGKSGPHHKKALSNGTLIRELGTLRAALAWAVKNDWILAARHVEMPTKPPARTRWLTREEVAKLFAACETQHIRMFLALALFTAARSGALLELTWDQVDLVGERIDLGQGTGRKRRAHLPIAPDLLPVLREAKQISTSAYVVEYRGGRVRSVKTGVRCAVERAGLSGVTPNVMRHTAATWMMQRGVPTALVASFLGNTETMVREVYGHASPEWLREGIAALSTPMPALGQRGERKGNSRPKETPAQT